MARPAPTTFQPFDPINIGVNQPIGTTREDILLDNVHFAYLNLTPANVLTTYQLQSQPYVEGRAAAMQLIDGIWNFDRPPNPFAKLELEVLFQNTAPTTPAGDGTIRFDWESDPWVSVVAPGTSVDLTAAGNSAQWQRVTGQLDLTSATDDTLRMWLVNGAAGVVRVHHVLARPFAPTSVSAGPTTQGSRTFYPGDTTEVDQDSPLAVAYRQSMWDNCEFVRGTRPGTPIGWSDDPQLRSGNDAYGVTAASATRVITLPFLTPLNVTKLRWGLYAYRVGASGTLTLTTLTDAAKGTAAQSITLGNTWTSPYSAALNRYDDVGKAALGVTPGQWDELRVELTGDGADPARIMSLCTWFAPF